MKALGQKNINASFCPGHHTVFTGIKVYVNEATVNCGKIGKFYKIVKYAGIELA